MIHTEQLELGAEVYVYALASPDGREVEFLNLRPMASVADRMSLAARWAGRNLDGVGVLAKMPDGRIHTALRPFPRAGLVALLNAFEIYCEAVKTAPADDSVAFCERLYRLEDARPN
jgi:hypothetical protein